MADATIYNNEYLRILKLDDTEYLFSFTNNEMHSLQFETYNLGSFISKTTTTDERVEHIINASSVMTLKQLLAHKHNKLSYQDCLQMILTFGAQLNILEKTKHYVFNSLQMENIIVINDTKFMYVSDTQLFMVDETQKITIDYPVDRFDFDSPEQSVMREIPYSLSKNVWLFSFASIVCFCLTNNPDSYEDKTYINKEQLLVSIELLPVYYTLLRCFNEEPSKRIFLHI